MPNPSLVVWSLSYTDAATNTPHPQSIAFPASISIDQIAEQVGIQVYIWHDAATVQEVFSGIPHSPVAQRSYTISKADFPSVAAQTVVNGTVGGAIFSVCAQVAMSTQDTPTGQTNPDGTPQMESFFAGAQMMTLDLVTGQMTAYP